LTARRLGEGVRGGLVELWHVAVEGICGGRWLDRLGLCLFGIVDEQGCCRWVKVGVFYSS
jgi:hypothetical protein